MSQPGESHDVSERKHEARGAREGGEHPPGATPPDGDDVVSTDGAQVGSEPMTAEATLSRLGKPDPGRVPPGRQLSGEPPAR